MPRQGSHHLRVSRVPIQITNQVIEAFSEILRRVPESSLILKNSALASTRARDFVQGLFEQYEVSASRVRLEGPSDHYRFLQTYSEIDIALDTFPYNGGTTTTEAIWQGVPVATFHGDRWASRTSASILRAAGLSELVGETVEDSWHSQSAWQNPQTISCDLRRNMRSRLLASPVCDTPSFARNMEGALHPDLHGK